MPSTALHFNNFYPWACLSFLFLFWSNTSVLTLPQNPFLRFVFKYDWTSKQGLDIPNYKTTPNNTFLWQQVEDGLVPVEAEA